MKYIYRFSLSDGQEHLKSYELDKKELQEFLQHVRWISMNDNLTVSTSHIVSIELIATSSAGVSMILKDDEYTIKQLNKYLKGIIK